MKHLIVFPYKTYFSKLSETQELFIFNVSCHTMLLMYQNVNDLKCLIHLDLCPILKNIFKISEIPGALNKAIS